MTLALTKGHPVVTAGLAAVTGTGVALGFTELGSTTSTWLLILATAIPLAVSSPFVAGWLSPELKHAWFFPVGVLGSLSIAMAIYGNLSLDSHPIAFVFALTVFYGGAASLAFCVGWIARQYLRRLRGHRLPVSHLAIASLVAACCSIALSALFIAIPLGSSPPPHAPYWSAALVPIGLIGVASGSAIIWSDRNRGRWGFLGLGLSLLYLGASLAPPVFLTTAHWYGPVALVLIGLAIWNVLRWRQGDERAALGDS